MKNEEVVAVEIFIGEKCKTETAKNVEWNVCLSFF